MKYCALVQARGGSKSIPRKNLLKIKGHSLIAWSVTAFSLISEISEVFISTVCEEIANEAKKYGAIVPFLRPKELAKDDSTDFELYEHFSNWLKSNNHSYENIVQVRPTTPARDIEVLKNCLKFASAEDSKATGFRSVFEMSETAWKTFELNNNYISPLTRYLNLNNDSANLPRQSLPATYAANGYIDIVKINQINKGDMYGESILPLIVPNSGEIDNINDVDYVNYAIDKNLTNYSKLIQEMDLRANLKLMINH